MTYEQFIAGVHAFLAIVTTFIAILTLKNRSTINKIQISVNGRLKKLFEDVEKLKKK